MASSNIIGEMVAEKYRIQKLLGLGAYGKVFLAIESQPNKFVVYFFFLFFNIFDKNEKNSLHLDHSIKEQLS